jgi:hypothetical protein
MRLILLLFVCILSLPSFALSGCPQGLPTSDVNFCSSFKTVAICHCTAMGIPRFLCKNMNNLYKTMILRYGSVDNACESQQDTSKQNCLDGWTCYRNGGSNSQGKLCSSTGKAC